MGNEPNGTNGHANGNGASNGKRVHPKHVLALPEPVMGAPTHYRAEYCDAIIAWFKGPRTEQVIRRQRTIPQKSGPPAEEIEWQTVGIGVPTMEGFASHLGYNSRTIREWAKKYPDFTLAFARARDMQRDWLVELATRNLISAGTFSYTMSNISDWRADPAPPLNPDRKAVFFFDPMKDSRSLPQEAALPRVAS
jgi:hypothetical protein